MRVIGNDNRVGRMRRVWRLLRYARPYALYSLASVVLMAVVGAMAGLRLYLIKPSSTRCCARSSRAAISFSFAFPG